MKPTALAANIKWHFTVDLVLNFAEHVSVGTRRMSSEPILPITSTHKAVHLAYKTSPPIVCSGGCGGCILISSVES